MYEIVDWGRLRRFSHIIWDIDGTITDRDHVSEEVTIKIINLALGGVYHTFITGRDGDWIINKVIQPMSRFFNFARVRDNLIFFAESGSVLLTRNQSGEMVQTVHADVSDHPLRKNKRGIRTKLRQLCFDPDGLKPYEKGKPVPPKHDVIYDANGAAFLVDRSIPSPPCHRYVASRHKRIFFTLEMIRDEKGEVKSFDQSQFAETVGRTIRKAGLANSMTAELSGTAIDVVPVVGGRPFGKSLAAGIALENITRDKLNQSFSLEDVLARTVAIGDGVADLDFSTPMFHDRVPSALARKRIPFIFVGQGRNLPKDGEPKFELTKNIIIRATGLGELQFNYVQELIKLSPAMGPRVASQILDFLKTWDYFGPFA